MKGFDHGLFNFPELSVHRVNGIYSPRKLLLLWAEGEKNLVYSILQLGSFVQWASTMVCYVHNRYYAMLLQPCLLVILPFELTMSLKMMHAWQYDSALKFRFKNGLSMSHFLPTFSILFDSCQFKALRAWLCVIDKNLGTWECLQQIWGQLICISSVYLSGFTAVIHNTRKKMSWIDLHILITYKAL